MDTTALLLSRLQFAFTISFHIIYPSFTIGLAAWLTVLEGLHLADAYLDAAGQPETCVVTEGALQHDEARQIVGRIDPAHVYTLPDALFGQLSSVVHGVGMVLLVEKVAVALPEVAFSG